MKTNDKLVIAATAIYSYLFYHQNAGINFLLFNLMLMCILLIRDNTLVKNKRWLLASAMCLISSISIFVNSSALAIIANIFSLVLLSAFSFRRTTSWIFSFLFSWYSVGTSIVQVLIDASTRARQSTEKESRGSKSYRLVSALVVVLLGILFFVLYQRSNPLFEKNTEWISFNFISFPWIIFTAAGFFIIYGLFYHKTIVQVDLWEQSLGSFNKTGDPAKAIYHRVELSSGIALFSLLNLMLLVLNAGDVSTIWLNGALPKGVSQSDFVHDGVELIILSIVIAATLIMFLFRRNFSTIQGYPAIRWLVYIWILQNLIMLFSTAWRNHIYIHDYNLTHKRIGVYAWIILAMIGLILILIKVKSERSNWFLVNANFTCWLLFLTLGSTINWDVWITRYNLRNKPITQVDFRYLFSLSDSNIPELMELARRKDFVQVNGAIKEFPEFNQTKAVTFRYLMKRKVSHYLKDYVSDWQSWDLRDKRIMNSLIKR